MALFLAAAAATETEDRKMLIPMVVVKDEPQGRKNSRCAAIFCCSAKKQFISMAVARGRATWPKK